MQRLYIRVPRVYFFPYRTIINKWMSTFLNVSEKIPVGQHVNSRHLYQMPSLVSRPSSPTLPRRIRTSQGDFVIREAELSDKEDVLKIRKNLYGGIDFLPAMYDTLVSQPHGKAFLAQGANKVVWFASAMLIDSGENCYIKGMRLSKELESKQLVLSFFNTVAEWAISHGAVQYVATNTNQVRNGARGIMNMNHMIYLIQLENVHLPWRDLDTSHHVLPIRFDQLSSYFRSEDVSHYLFPSRRIMVDIVPYKLIDSNTTLMNDLSGDHTQAFSDVRIDNGTLKGLLSFGTLFRAQQVSYVYGVEIYGTDVSSVKSHIVRHLTELQKTAYGSVCLMLFVQDDFPQQAADKICLEFGFKRINYPGTKYTEWNFQKEIVIQRDFLITE